LPIQAFHNELLVFDHPKSFTLTAFPSRAEITDPWHIWMLWRPVWPFGYGSASPARTLAKYFHWSAVPSPSPRSMEVGASGLIAHRALSVGFGIGDHE